jgi:hypothetical protein
MIVHLAASPLISAPNAAVYLTMSIGVSPSPGVPPMVPLIPEIDLIKVTFY